MSPIVPLLAMGIAIITGWAIIKRYNPQLVLFFSGFLLVTISVLGGNLNILPGNVKSTGFIGFDIMEVLRQIFMRQMTTTGFLILVTGGFATYMDRIGAANRLVDICINPLRKLKSPYLVLGCGFLIGHYLGIVLPSASGLAMLLIVAMYPLLVGLGISRISAAAIISCNMVMSYCPTSPLGQISANTVGLDPITFLIKYQLPIAVPAALTVAVAHALTQRHFDAKERLGLFSPSGLPESIHPESTDGGVESADKNRRNVPAYYALLPIVPLVLLIIFSPLVWKTIVLSTPTAMFISWLIALVVELVHSRKPKKMLEDGMAMFKGMSIMLVTVVSLLCMAEYFATGLRTSGLIDMLVRSAKGVGLGMTGSTIVVSLLIALVTILTGSGVAAFTSLASLAPEVSGSLGGEAVAMIVPMQFASEMLRNLSPVAGVMIICAGAAGTTTIVLVKRCAIPCILGMLVIFTANIILFM